jgi:hypothetical protein
MHNSKRQLSVWVGTGIDDIECTVEEFDVYMRRLDTCKLEDWNENR